MTPKPQGKVRNISAGGLPPPMGKLLSLVSGSKMPAFTNSLLNSIAATVWNYRDDTPEAKNERAAAALSAVRAFEPKNEIESMMAAQAVALHLAAMECARRAMLADQPGEAAMRLRRDAAILSRAMVDMAEAIDRRRGKGPQVVRVERVVVHEGGQAIVGTLTAGATAAGGEGNADGLQGKPHAPRALEEREQSGGPYELIPLLCPDPERTAMPRPGDG